MRTLTANLVLALALLATPLLAHVASGDRDTGGDDGHVSFNFSVGGETRTWALSTLENRTQVRVQLVAHVSKSSIRVRIVDPDGREVTEMDGSGELETDSGAIRVVDHPAGKDEARRGTWSVEVTTGKGKGSFELRWWGLAPPSKPGGEGDSP